MKELLQALALAKDMIDVNIAAGLMIERLQVVDGPTEGQRANPALKPD